MNGWSKPPLMGFHLAKSQTEQLSLGLTLWNLEADIHVVWQLAIIEEC